MRSLWPLLLCAYLVAWIPLNFAVELTSVLPSLAMRGTAAALEIGLHALVTLICAIAGVMVWTGAPPALPFAAIAVAAAGAVTLQSLFWTSLPRALAPGERLPLAALTIGYTVFWLVWIRVSKDNAGA
jgi:hypothetical protein